MSRSNLETYRAYDIDLASGSDSNKLLDDLCAQNYHYDIVLCDV